MTQDDIATCNNMHKQVVGVSRKITIEESVKANSSLVAINSENQIVGYEIIF